ISLFMTGGPSHVDTFDPKPALARYAGQPLTGKGDINVRQGYPGPLMPSPFQFKKYGQSGIEISEIFPNLASMWMRWRSCGLFMQGPTITFSPLMNCSRDRFAPVIPRWVPGSRTVWAPRPAACPHSS